MVQAMQRENAKRGIECGRESWVVQGWASWSYTANTVPITEEKKYKVSKKLRYQTWRSRNLLGEGWGSWNEVTMGKQNPKPVDNIAHNQKGKENHMITTNGVGEKVLWDTTRATKQLERIERD